MRHLLATTALVTLAALPMQAHAQSDGTQAGSDKEWNVAVGETRVSLDNLVGARVYMAEDGNAGMDGDVTDPMDNWEDIGEIGDIYVNGDGEIASIVVDVGGFLGMGEREVALTMDQLKLKEDADDEGDVFVVYTGPRSALEEQEEFQSAEAEQDGFMSYRDERAADDMNMNDTASDDAKKSNDMARDTNLSMRVGDMDISADNILGQSVYIRNADNADTAIEDAAEDVSDNWERVGEIGDLVLSKDGEITSVVVDAGGFLGMGEKHIQTNMDEVKFVRDSNDEGDFFIVFTGDRSKLEDREEMDRDAWRDEGGSFYGDSRPAENVGMQAGNVDSMNAASDDDQQMADNAAMSDELRRTLTADDLDGTNVYGPNEDSIGEIGHLVMGEDGKITHIVIDVGGWLGIGEKPVALKYDELTLRNDDNGNLWVQTQYTQEELETMPDWEG